MKNDKPMEVEEKLEINPIAYPADLGMSPKGNIVSWSLPLSSPMSTASWSRSSAIALLPTLGGHHASPPSSDDRGVRGVDAAAPSNDMKPADGGENEKSESDGDARRESGDVDETSSTSSLCAGVVVASISEIFPVMWWWCSPSPSTASSLLCVFVIVAAMMSVACAVGACCGGPCPLLSVAIVIASFLKGLKVRSYCREIVQKSRHQS